MSEDDTLANYRIMLLKFCIWFEEMANMNTQEAAKHLVKEARVLLEQSICKKNIYGYVVHEVGCIHDPDSYCGWCGRPLPCPEVSLA